MDSQVIISVYLPAAYKTFELSVPLCVTVKELVSTVSKMIEPYADGLYCTGDTPVFIEKSSNQILGYDMTLDTLAVGNGAQFILI